MARRCAIAVGVKNSGSLVPLPGAISAAEWFGAWASSEEFDFVKVITDKGKKPVVAKALQGAVKKVLADASGDDSLFLYFAGHGLLFGSSTDTWLLSDWENDPNEVINVTQSSLNARMSGLQHIVLISDACRTAGGKGSVGLGGFVIFPHKPAFNVVTQWDEFYATRRGMAAQLPPTDAQIVETYPVFSSVLFEGLRGAASEELPADPRKLAVTAQCLKVHVEREVPARSGALPGGFVQYPEGLPSSLDPYRIYAYLKPDGVGPTPKAPPSPPKAARPRTFMPTLTTVFGWSDSQEPESPVAPVQPSSDEILTTATNDLSARILATVGRQSFETHVGLTVVGARVLHAEVHGGGDLFDENDAQHVRGYGDKGLATALRLDDGRWIATTMFPGFIGTILLGRNGVDSISYVPSGSSPRYLEYDVRQARETLSRALAELTVHGIVPQGQEAARRAHEWRQFKHANPSLGILAAHAYFSASVFDQVRSVAQYMIAESEFVPYDVLQLMEKSPTDAADMAARFGVLDPVVKCAGSFPILTLGWALIDRDDDRVHPVVRRCLPGVLPCTWAMLRDKEGRLLADAIQQGVL